MLVQHCKEATEPRTADSRACTDTYITLSVLHPPHRLALPLDSPSPPVTRSPVAKISETDSHNWVVLYAWWLDVLMQRHRSISFAFVPRLLPKEAKWRSAGHIRTSPHDRNTARRALADTSWGRERRTELPRYAAVEAPRPREIRFLRMPRGSSWTLDFAGGTNALTKQNAKCKGLFKVMLISLCVVH